VAPTTRLSGIDGLRAIVALLDGFELPAAAWEASVLPARMERYEPSLLDAICLTGEVGWGRLSRPGSAATNAHAGSSLTSPVPATPIAIFLREHAPAWRALRAAEVTGGSIEPRLDEPSLRVLEHLCAKGASFFRDLALACGLTEQQLRPVLARLAGAGLVTSDGFAGLRVMIRGGGDGAMSSAGRWTAAVEGAPAPGADAGGDADERATEAFASALLRRYGVVFRRLLTRETNPPAWRLLTRVYRRLEARGELRGGRFVAGMSGEQFALPGAVERLREIRRTAADGRLMVVSAADPLNLAGVLDNGDRVRAVAGNRLVYRDGVALAAMEGDYIRQMAPFEPTLAGDVASTLAGRRVPGVISGYIGRSI
jgi:ATP-dependent Lhr-like helicase